MSAKLILAWRQLLFWCSSCRMLMQDTCQVLDFDACRGDCAMTRPEAGNGCRPCHRPLSTLKIKHIAWVFCLFAWTLGAFCCCCCLANDVWPSETYMVTASAQRNTDIVARWAVRWCPCCRCRWAMTRAHSFPRAAEVRAEPSCGIWPLPRNFRISAEFHGILRKHGNF